MSSRMRPSIPRSPRRIHREGIPSRCRLRLRRESRGAAHAILIGMVSLVTLVAAPLGSESDDPKSGPQPFGSVGVVQKVAEDGKGFALKARKGPYQVTWPDPKDSKNKKKVRWVEHEQKTLGDLAEGTVLHVLGHEQEPTPTATGSFPPRLIKIQAIVVGSEFTPPPVSPKLGIQGIAWMTGKLKKRDNELHLGEPVLGVGTTREVLVIRERKAGAPKRRTPVFVAGFLDDSDRRHKKLDAREIIVIAPKYPSYDLTHAFDERKPAPEETGGREGFGF